MTDERTSASCRCGKVELKLAGAPIFRAICYCTSNGAARMIQISFHSIRATLASPFLLANEDNIEELSHAS
jgi:hypothetical protein